VSKNLSVLVDTSYLITVYDKNRPNNGTAYKYYRYFLKNKITMLLSTIVITEFQQGQPVADIINSGHYIILPFNFDDAVKAADIAYNLGGTDRRGDSMPKFEDDLKIMAQAEFNKIDFIITEDESTLARYCKKLQKAGMFDSKVIVVKDGFDASWFNDGQSTLLDEEDTS